MNTISRATSHSTTNIEKFCPSVLQCYPRAFGPRVTLHNFRAIFFSVDLGTCRYLYIVDRRQRSIFVLLYHGKQQKYIG